MAATSTDRLLRSDVAMLFRRAGFGARPDDLDRAESIGYEATVDVLLEQLGAPDTVGDELPPPPFAPIDGRDARGDQAARAAVQRQRAAEGRALVQWWVERMVRTATPVREKLTLFWHGHFATSMQKVRFPQLMLAQNQLLRSLGAGPFEALALGVAKDPAMLLWLDAASNGKRHANENFARELMELFTLGLGNYSESDVREAARCFTGWRLDRATGTFALDARQHDPGVKTVLGQSGAFGGEDVVAIVCRQSACARFVAARVWSHYARPVSTDDPVADDLATSFAPGLVVRDLLRATFLHPEFRSDSTRTGLVKTPVEYVVGTLRALGLAGDDPAILGLLESLGQVPFMPPSVGGWPQNGYWLSTASSLARLGFAEQVARRADLSDVASVSAAARPEAVARLLCVPAWSPPTRAALAGAADDPKLVLALALVSPDWVLA